MTKKNDKSYVYIIQCMDLTYYTGVTNHISRRFREHATGGARAARYTKNHGVLRLCCYWEAPSRSAAMKLEYVIKQLRRWQKEDLMAHPETLGTIYATTLKGFSFTPPYRTAFQSKRLQTTHHRRRKSRQRLIRIKPKTQIAIPANCLKERASLYNKIPTNSKTQARLIFATSEAVLTFQPAR